MAIDRSYLVGLGSTCNARSGPVTKPFIAEDGVELHVAVFEDAPEAAYETAFSCGLSEVAAGTDLRFELVIVMKDRRKWGEWLGSLIRLSVARTLRPGVIWEQPTLPGRVTGFVAAPPHMGSLRDAVLRFEGTRVRFLQLYPLFGRAEVELVKCMGAQAFLGAAWQRAPEALFSPSRECLAGILGE